MPLVNVIVNNRPYAIACEEGDEENLKALAAYVDTKVRELLESVGQVGDQRLMLMAAVLIAEELFDARAKLEAQSRKAGDLASAQERTSAERERAEESAVVALEQAARRIENIAARLGQA